MIEFYASPHVVDLILGLMLLEGIGLVVYHRKTGRGIPTADLVVNFLAGFVLLVAVRLALSGASWVWVVLCLTASLPVHLADLWRRWPKR
ncbi:MAG: hypothetical protein WBP72_04515 [Rhodocyclaceae bacterium]|jgi:hypothetical protein